MSGIVTFVKDRIGERRGLADYSLIFIVLFLLSFGLVMLYSTSSYESMAQYNDAAYYLKKQMIFTLFGLFLMVGVSLFPYTLLKKFSVLAYVVSVGLILLIIPFGKEVNGAKRWLDIPLLPIQLQPAEVAKIGLIIFSAMFIEKLGRKALGTVRGFIVPMVPAVAVGVMLWKITDNLSSAIIVIAIVFGMLFVACPDYGKFILIAAVVLVVAVALVWYTVNSADTNSLDFRGERVLAWLDPQAYAGGKGYQTIQALYAIGSGGMFGKGLGQSMQKLGFIPEAQNDMIFSIICEELGLFGAISIMLMFILLLWRFMMIANSADDFYGAMLVVGVISHIAVQVILNIAVVTNTIPNTGVTLPFISYGGSSVVFLLIEVGIVLSVSRGMRREELARLEES
ncbi:MAG: cell division protein FtsW [Lachnospiraceae bacterium]|nr:cell division protein FtsW [Lachnospiraceae bacterium]